MTWNRRLVAIATNLFLILLLAMPQASATQPQLPLLEVTGQVLSAENSASQTSITASVNDAEGNVYVAGLTNLNSFVVGKDAGGNDVSLVGTTGMGFIVKYNVAGQVIWAKSYVQTWVNHAPTGIALDSTSPPNVFVTGWLEDTINSFGNAGSHISVAGPVGGLASPYVVELNGTDGTAVWANSFGTTNLTIIPLSIAVRNDGGGTKVYLAGTAKGDNGTYNFGSDVGPPINYLKGGFLALIDVASSTSQTRTALVPYQTGNSGDLQFTTVAVTVSGDVYAVARLADGNLVAPQVITASTTIGLLVGYDATLSTRKQLITLGNLAGFTLFTLRGLTVDDSHLYLTGWLKGNAGYTFTTVNGTQTLMAPVGAGFVAKASIADQAANPGRVQWVTPISGASPVEVVGQGNSDPVRYNPMAVDGSGVISVAFLTNGAGDLTNPELRRVGTARNVVVLRLSADGRVLGGVSTGADAGFELANGGGVATSGLFTIAGTMKNDFTSPQLAHGDNVSAGLVMRAAPNYTVSAAKAGTGVGKVTSDIGGLDCGTTCRSTGVAAGTSVKLAALADAGSTFVGWSGPVGCSGTTSPLSLSLAADITCTATFNLSGGPSSPAQAPPVTLAPPPFVVNPPATIENALTVGSGSGSVSFASSFTNTANLTFSAAPPAGGNLPSWLTFDPASVSFNFNVPLPPDLPIQPLAAGDVRTGRADARANWSNTVYPLLLRVAQLPVVLTATDRTTGEAYASTIQMSFHAPRTPVAISLVSMSLDRMPGDRSSGRSALSYDGGQMIFETASTNLFPAASSPYGDIVRYHGLSGARDRLSQTAIPGGGVANAADGLSYSPAVSADGAYGAFASDAPSVSETPAGARRQVYRVALGYPRVALNPAATPAPVMVSATSAGVAGNGTSDNPSVSLDGRYVAFDSTATNLEEGLDGSRRVWRKDLSTGAIVQVGLGANPSISWDGRFVAFENAGRIQLMDLPSGVLRTVAAGVSARLSARADRVAFVQAAKVVQVDLMTGMTREVGTGDQPAMSADGRFVAFRAGGTSGFTQIWLRDVDRGVTALVTQTAAGIGGSGNSLHPSVSGDGTQVGFSSAANDLVNGSPAGTQAYVAANPLLLPEKTGYWYQAASNGGQAWLMQRWGIRAYVGGLAYDATGRPTWVAGLCEVTGLTCRGTLSGFTSGAPFGAAGGAAPASAPVAAMTLTTSEDGRSTTLQLGNAAAQTLSPFAIAGTATTGFAGLPQAGWWYEPASTGGNGYFIAVNTQPQGDGSVRQMAHVSVLTFDMAGQAVWYSSQAALGADLGFSGTLMQYLGGAPFGQNQAGVAGGSAVGQMRIAFDGSDRARISLPNGRVADIVPNRF